MNGRMGIERRIFFLMLLTGLACFAAFEAVSFLGMYDVQEHAIESGREMGTSAAAFPSVKSIPGTIKATRSI